MAPTTSQAVDGISRLLSEAGLARYSPTGAYSAGPLPAVFSGKLPPAPAAAMSIRVYDERRDADDDNPDLYVQIKVRLPGGDIRAVDDLMDAIRARLHRKSRFALPGGVRVLQCSRKVRGLTEPDANDLWTRPDSYMFTLEANGTP